MFYPAYIHKDKKSAYSVTLPDFPGCFSAADTFNDLPAAIHEALALYFEGEALPIPAPTAPEAWARDKRFSGGYWLMVDVDTAKFNTKSVRLNISLPECLVREIDAFAKSRHVSRSAFLADAARHSLAP